MAINPLSAVPLSLSPARDTRERLAGRLGTARPADATPPVQDSTDEARRAVNQAERMELERAAARLNELMVQKQISIEFSVDDESGRTIMQVVDTETRELLRQYPARHILAISRQIEQFSGLFVRTQA